MEKHHLEKSLQQQSNPAQPNLNPLKNIPFNSGIILKEALQERAVGASQAAKNIIKLMSSDFNDDQLDAILQAHLSALDTAVQFELQAEEFEPAKEVL